MKWKIGSIVLLLALFITQAYTLNPAYIKTILYGIVISIIGLFSIVTYWKYCFANHSIKQIDIPEGKEKTYKILKLMLAFLYADIILGTIIAMCITICAIVYSNPI